MIRLAPLTSAIAGIALLGTTSCSTLATSNARSTHSATGHAKLVAANGASLGKIIIRVKTDGSTALTINAAGLPAGLHGLHLHERGVCEGPAFASAGGHWNPTGRQHGRDNPAGAHSGDLPNLVIGASGSGTAAIFVGAIGQSFADSDGTSLVIHAKSDDYRTDPSGNSGTRIACAVIAPPK